MKVVKVPLDENFYDLDGNIMKDEKGNPVTVRSVLRIALANEFPEDTSGGSAAAVELKLKNFDLINDLRDCKDDVFHMVPEEADRLKKRVALAFGTLVAGPVHKFLSKVEEFVHPVAVVTATPPASPIAPAELQSSVAAVQGT